MPGTMKDATVGGRVGDKALKPSVDETISVCLDGISDGLDVFRWGFETISLNRGVGLIAWWRTIIIVVGIVGRRTLNWFC